MTMRTVSVLLIAATLVACGQQQDESAPAPETPTEPAGSIYAAAVDDPARSDDDRGRDAGRKPAEVLEFFRISEGMTVLDMYSGGGYYSEIIARVVGDSGKVIAQTNEAYLGYVGDEFRTRYANDRLPNVEVLMAENNELSLKPESLDAVMLILTYHDFIIDNPGNGWPLIDVPALLAEFHKGLKPGGIVGIVDHYAAPGSPAETGDTLHRIDPALVIAGMEAAGFELLESSDILRNPDDDHTRSVFEPDMRGNTDRFVMRFGKTAP